MDFDEEKRNVKGSSSTVADNNNYDDDLLDPPQEESLHRGLKARQISMIAVCRFASS